MAHKKKLPPGLDEVVTEADLDRFMTGDPVFAEAPERTWPAVVLAVIVAATVGVVAGVLVAPYVTGLQVSIAVGFAVTGIAAFYTTAFDG